MSVVCWPTPKLSHFSEGRVPALETLAAQRVANPPPPRSELLGRVSDTRSVGSPNRVTKRRLLRDRILEESVRHSKRGQPKQNRRNPSPPRSDSLEESFDTRSVGSPNRVAENAVFSEIGFWRRASDTRSVGSLKRVAENPSPLRSDSLEESFDTRSVGSPKRVAENPSPLEKSVRHSKRGQRQARLVLRR